MKSKQKGGPGRNKLPEGEKKRALVIMVKTKNYTKVRQLALKLARQYDDLPE
jgi:hypothetical protein